MRSATRKKIGKDPAYLKWLQNQPCLVCNTRKEQQRSRTEAAHVGLRGLSQKCPDREAIPLCRDHHREQHRHGKKFWKDFGLSAAGAILYCLVQWQSEHRE